MKLMTKPMTQEQQKNALKLFSKYLKNNNISFVGANPISDNCYISSGDIEGIFFPNTCNFSKDNMLYRIICLSLVDNELSLVKVLKSEFLFNADFNKKHPDFPRYSYQSLKSLVYDYYYLEIENKLNQSKKYYLDELETINKIKVVSRKNGEEFKDVLENFEGVASSIKYGCISGCPASVSFGGVVLSRDTKNIDNPTITKDEIIALINDYKTRRENYIKDINKDLKELEKNYNKIKKLVKKINDALEPIKNKYSYKEIIKKMF